MAGPKVSFIRRFHCIMTVVVLDWGRSTFSMQWVGLAFIERGLTVMLGGLSLAMGVALTLQVCMVVYKSVCSAMDPS